VSDRRIAIIAAMTENRVIGRNGTIPWDLPEDRRHFRELTMGHPVIMGRKTFESIGRPLPGRTTIILSRQRDFLAEGCLMVPDLEAALTAASGNSEIFICGGGELYREALPRAARLYLTIVHMSVDGDTFFPEIPAGEFVEVVRRGGNGLIPFDFVTLERK
jgi:dihydrofolate reductase